MHSCGVPSFTSNMTESKLDRKTHAVFALARRQRARELADELPQGWRTYIRIRHGITGLHDGECFWSSNYAKHRLGLRQVVGLHYSCVPSKRDDPPIIHAVNLDDRGRLVDVTWGSDPLALGVFVGYETDEGQHIGKADVREAIELTEKELK